MGHRGSLKIAVVSSRAHQSESLTEKPTIITLMHLGYAVFIGICHCPVLVTSGNSLDLHLRVCFRRVDQDAFPGKRQYCPQAIEDTTQGKLYDQLTQC